jgi:hypothetical protein
LLAQVVQETEAPMTRLGGALTRMAQVLAELGKPAAEIPGAGYSAELQVLSQEIAVCIENLQFHDRLVQELTHVTNLLRGVADERVLASVSVAPTAKGSIELF